MHDWVTHNQQLCNVNPVHRGKIFDFLPTPCQQKARIPRHRSPTTSASYRLKECKVIFEGKTLQGNSGLGVYVNLLYCEQVVRVHLSLNRAPTVAPELSFSCENTLSQPRFCPADQIENLVRAPQSVALREAATI